MNAFSRGIRNAFRNTIRTVAIVGMLSLSIGLSLSMLLAHQAIGQKITSVQKNIGNTISIAPAGIRGFDGGGTPLTSDAIKKVKSLTHITSIDQSVNDRLGSDTTNIQSSIDAGSFGRRQFRNEGGGGGDVAFGGESRQAPDLTNFTLPIPVTGSTNPLGSVSGSSDSSVTLVSGNVFDGSKDADVALMGKGIADKNSLKTGSTFAAYGTTITVSGIFDGGNTFSNNQIIMPLPTIQRLSSQSNTITSAIVHIDSAVNLGSTTNAIKNALGSTADITNDADTAKATLGSLQNIQNVSLFSLIGAAGTAAVIILLTMVMIVRERRREIGILKAIGASNVRVMLQFTVESITLTVLAAAIGIIIGSLAATPVTKLLANNSTSDTTASQTAPVGERPGPRLMGGGFRTHFNNNGAIRGIKNLRANVDASILGYGFGSAILIAAIGSTAAAGLIAKVRPSEVMRAE